MSIPISTQKTLCRKNTFRKIGVTIGRRLLRAKMTTGIRIVDDFLKLLNQLHKRAKRSTIVNSKNSKEKIIWNQSYLWFSSILSIYLNMTETWFKNLFVVFYFNHLHIVIIWVDVHFNEIFLTYCLVILYAVILQNMYLVNVPFTWSEEWESDLVKIYKLLVTWWIHSCHVKIKM